MGIKIACASGKGGTGKTTISTNLAHIMSTREKVKYLDCDVEDPNGHLFLRPSIKGSETVSIKVPKIDKDTCTRCGKCSDFCHFNAIANLGKTMLIFDELCHGCGGCAILCPEKAITEVDAPIGTVEYGKARNMDFVTGRLDVGQPMSPPLIRSVIAHSSDDTINILDAPPGTACPATATVREADVALLVAEPTPFGFNDLKLAVDLLNDMDVPFGVFINRSDMGDDCVEAYCTSKNIPVWGSLPHDLTIAKAYSEGALLTEATNKYNEVFDTLAKKVMEAAIR